MRKHRRRQHERQSHFRRTAAFPSCVCPQAHSVPLPAPDLSLIFCARSPARHFVKAHLLDDPGLVQHIIGHVRAVFPHGFRHGLHGERLQTVHEQRHPAPPHLLQPRKHMFLYRLQIFYFDFLIIHMCASLNGVIPPLFFPGLPPKGFDYVMNQSVEHTLGSLSE